MRLPPSKGLVLRDVGFSYPHATQAALRNIGFELGPGQVMGVLGPSGCGKSSLLRAIAGLEQVSGEVWVNGQNIGVWPPERRGVGLVFQDYALFAHLSVAGNVGYGLVEQRVPRPELERRVDSALEQVRLTGFGSRRIDGLSGGERQRVALARALVTAPRVLLLDEPLANLDANLRVSLRQELARLVRQPELVTVLVTHDQREAFELSDLVAIMRAGQLLQFGPAREVFAHPANRWVAGFLGHQNLLEPKEAQALNLLPLGPYTLLPEAALRLVEVANSQTLPTRVTEARFEGQSNQLRLECQGVVLHLAHPEWLPEGSHMHLEINPRKAVAVPA